MDSVVPWSFDQFRRNRVHRDISKHIKLIDGGLVFTTLSGQPVEVPKRLVKAVETILKIWHYEPGSFYDGRGANANAEIIDYAIALLLHDYSTNPSNANLEYSEVTNKLYPELFYFFKHIVSKEYADVSDVGVVGNDIENKKPSKKEIISLQNDIVRSSPAKLEQIIHSYGSKMGGIGIDIETVNDYMLHKSHQNPKGIAKLFMWLDPKKDTSEISWYESFLMAFGNQGDEDIRTTTDASNRQHFTRLGEYIKAIKNYIETNNIPEYKRVYTGYFYDVARYYRKIALLNMVAGQLSSQIVPPRPDTSSSNNFSNIQEIVGQGDVLMRYAEINDRIQRATARLMHKLIIKNRFLDLTVGVNLKNAINNPGPTDSGSIREQRMRLQTKYKELRMFAEEYYNDVLYGKSTNIEEVKLKSTIDGLNDDIARLEEQLMESREKVAVIESVSSEESVDPKESERQIELQKEQIRDLTDKLSEKLEDLHQYEQIMNSEMGACNRKVSALENELEGLRESENFDNDLLELEDHDFSRFDLDPQLLKIKGLNKSQIQALKLIKSYIGGLQTEIRNLNSQKDNIRQLMELNVQTDDFDKNKCLNDDLCKLILNVKTKQREEQVLNEKAQEIVKSATCKGVGSVKQNNRTLWKVRIQEPTGEERISAISKKRADEYISGGCAREDPFLLPTREEPRKRMVRMPTPKPILKKSSVSNASCVRVGQISTKSGQRWRVALKDDDGHEFIKPISAKLADQYISDGCSHLDRFIPSPRKPAPPSAVKSKKGSSKRSGTRRK